MTHNPGALAALRTQIARLEGFGRDHAAARAVLPFGLPAVDQAIPGAGLVLGALHEFAGTAADTEHGAAPALLIAGLAGRLTGSVVWIVGRHAPHAPALAAVGLPPGRLLFVEAGASVLQTMEDCVRHAGLAAVVGELTGSLGLTTSRRLQLAAEGSGVTAFALRRSRKHDDPLLDAPNAALTRWRVSGVPSPSVLPDEPDVPGVGRPRWRLELRRARGSRPFHRQVIARAPGGARSAATGSLPDVARDYDGGHTTGFVSPASDSLEGPIDLSEVLDLRRPHRYPVRVKGDALTERGIQHGDILIADAAASPAAGRVVIAMIHGDVLVCQLAYRRGQWWLKPSGPDKEPLAVADEAEIWAVVAALVRTEV